MSGMKYKAIKNCLTLHTQGNLIHSLLLDNYKILHFCIMTANHIDCTSAASFILVSLTAFMLHKFLLYTDSILKRVTLYSICDWSKNIVMYLFTEVKIKLTKFQSDPNWTWSDPHMPSPSFIKINWHKSLVLGLELALCLLHVSQCMPVRKEADVVKDIRS